MSSPTKTNVQTLDYVYRGSPWVRVATKSGINLDGLDYQYRGEPFWGIEEVASNASDSTPIYLIGQANTSSSKSVFTRGRLYPAGCIVYHNADQSITSGVSYTTLAFNSEKRDVDSMHDTSTNNERITFNHDGIYLVNARVVWSTANTGLRDLSIFNQSATNISSQMSSVITTTLDWGQTNSVILKATAGNYVYLRARQNSGSPRNILYSSGESPYFSAISLPYAEYCFLSHSTNTSVAFGNWAALEFDTEDYDYFGMHNGTNPSRITVPTTGRYMLYGSIQWEGNGTLFRDMVFVVNGSTDYHAGQNTENPVPILAWNNTLLTTLNLNANDYVELQVRQASGGALNVNAVSGRSPVFRVVRLNYE